MKNKTIIISIALLTGLFFGWLIFHPSGKPEGKEAESAAVKKVTVWTCSMHPQIRMEAPGKCPICGMDLIPLGQSGPASADPDAVQLSKEAAALADISTTFVAKHSAVKEVHLFGKVAADERSLQSQVTHIPGRIEKLNVNFTGETVQKGQVLAQIYSPELINAQKELLEAAKVKQTQPSIYEASKAKLLQWKLTPGQISGIEESGMIQNAVDVISNTSGIVTGKRVNTGDYVSQGAVLFDIADLSKVWIMFDAYESDLLFLRKGENVSFTLQSLPGDKFRGSISFIDPFLDPVTRVAKVRVEAENSSYRLKPEMFVSGTVSSSLNDFKDNLVIPSSAVLWTGRRSIVYVKQPSTDGPVFKIREIELGPSLGDSFIIMNGLSEGEEIVTKGTFSVDAAAQLEGKTSMMNSFRINNIPVKNETLSVSGNCDMCKERIEKAASSVPGVSSAFWDMNTKNLIVDFDSSRADISLIGKAVAGAGHDNAIFRADDEVYKALPVCCLYRKQKQ